MSANATATETNELVAYGVSAVPDNLWTCNYGVTGCATFPALTGCTTGSPCTTTIRVSPMGDQWSSEYDGDFGTGFFVPNSSSFIFISVHSYGPSTQGGETGGAACSASSSGSNDDPIPPDTTNNVQLQVTAYSAQQFYNAKQGTQPVYQASPYTVWAFPGQSNWAAANGCIQTGVGGFYFNPTTDILYGDIGTKAGSGGEQIIGEWKVSGP